jgi:hypothetical protein
VNQGNRQVSGDQPYLAVEANVIDGPGHRLQANGSCALGPQPLDARANHGGSEALALPIRADGKRPHPTFRAGSVNHVESDHVTFGVPPNHRAIAGVFERIPPNQIVQLGYPHAD